MLLLRLGMELRCLHSAARRGSILSTPLQHGLEVSAPLRRRDPVAHKHRVFSLRGEAKSSFVLLRCATVVG